MILNCNNNDNNNYLYLNGKIDTIAYILLNQQWF